MSRHVGIGDRDGARLDSSRLDDVGDALANVIHLKHTGIDAARADARARVLARCDNRGIGNLYRPAVRKRTRADACGTLVFVAARSRCDGAALDSDLVHMRIPAAPDAGRRGNVVNPDAFIRGRCLHLAFAANGTGGRHR